MSIGEYHGFRPRPRPAGIPPLTRGTAPDVPAPVRALFEQVKRAFREPFVGITTDGTPRQGLAALGRPDGNTKPARTAAAAFLGALDATLRRRVALPVDAAEWRIWTNAFPTWETHGILLDDLDPSRRELALQVVRASLSDRGYSDARTVMLLNRLLGELIGDYRDTLDEYIYWFTLFGDVTGGGPWGWQLAGHHLDIHYFSVGSQMVLTPMFLGAEAAHIDHGDSAGTRMFDAEQSAGLSLLSSLTSAQHDQAVICSSMRSADLPPHLDDILDGRQRTGPGKDNAVLPYEGACSAGFDREQRSRLLAVLDVYVGRMPGDHAAAKMREIERYLGETHFAWVGDGIAGHPFYYKVHSPVILVEFDHHSGVFLDNDEPQPFHVHTIVRTPNGGDYGKDLLRQHYATAHHSARHSPHPEETRP
jgi:hypothetical protein